jgi:hypothetical protein
MSHALPLNLPRLFVQAGSILFLLWGVLHLWVGYAGLVGYSTGLAAQWGMLTGGIKVPREALTLPVDAPTALAQSQLLINFCIDVAGYGLLSLFVAWGLWARSSWLAYAVGALVIGMGDLAFTFCLVMPGVIEKTFPVVAGPVLWVLAVALTPIGLLGTRAAQASGHLGTFARKA